MTDREFLLAVQDYIEGAEEACEGEFGSGRSLRTLIAEGRMPALHAEVIRRLSQPSSPIPGAVGTIRYSSSVGRSIPEDEYIHRGGKVE